MKYGGLTKEEFEEAQKLIDPEGAQAQNIAQVSKKGFWRDIKKAILEADIVVEVLDARDPDGSRCSEVEDLVSQNDKKLILINNKVDLVPLEIADAWQKYYKGVGLQCINFKSNQLLHKEGEEADEEEQR